MAKQKIAAKDDLGPAPLSRMVPSRSAQESEVGKLLSALSDRSRSPASIQRKEEAMSASSRFPDPRLTSALASIAIDDPDPGLRASAVVSLAERDGREVVGCLSRTLLHDPDPQVRWHSALALKSFHDYRKEGKEQAPQIIGALISSIGSDPVSRNRAMSVSKLGEIALTIPLRSSPVLKNRTIAALAKGSRDPDKDVRLEAVWALSAIGRPKSRVSGGGISPAVEDAKSMFDPMLVAPVLAIVASQDPDPDVKRVAGEELERVLEWKKTMEMRRKSGKP